MEHESLAGALLLLTLGGLFVFAPGILGALFFLVVFMQLSAAVLT